MFVVEDTRKLARIVRIDDIKAIEKADRLEIAVVGGWECIVQKGMYQVGDLAVYFEIDASIPLDSGIWCGFDKNYLTIKKDEAQREYAVIKTLRMRGALSQGLVLQLKNLDGLAFPVDRDLDSNLTQALGILKYVSPQEAKLYVTASNSDDRRASGWIWKFRNWLTKGIVSDGLIAFPYGHVKSDEERVQNRSKQYEEMVNAQTDCELSIKFDGESALFYTDTDTKEVGVAQRNWGLRTEDIPYTWFESLRVYLADWVRFIARRLRGGDCDRPQWKKGYMAQSIPLVRYFFKERIRERFLNLNLAIVRISQDPTLESPLRFLVGKWVSIQGEMVGPDFNNNKENCQVNTFYMYRAYLNGNLLCTPEQARIVAKAMSVEYVPVLDEKFVLPANMKDILKLADGPGHFDLKRKREGVVVKDNTSNRSFKIISNKWLEAAAKEDDSEQSS